MSAKERRYHQATTESVYCVNRYMWMRTTQTTYWNRLTESHSSTYLPSISSHVDAAYDIPAKGVAYIFTGRVMGSLQSIT